MTTVTTHDPPAGTDDLDDPSDLGGMFDRYAGDLLRYAAQRVGPDAAEDVVAQAFLVAHEHRHRYDPARSPMLPWLYGICTNIIRKHRRLEVRRLRAMTRAATATGHIDSPSHESVDAKRTVAKLAGVLAAMPRRQRDVLLLYAVAELEYAEIAIALGIPLGSVRSALHRARVKVRAAIHNLSGSTR